MRGLAVALLLLSVTLPTAARAQCDAEPEPDAPTRAAARPHYQAGIEASRVALDVSDGAVQVLGGHGYIRDYLPEMHLRNARGVTHFEALTLV